MNTFFTGSLPQKRQVGSDFIRLDRRDSGLVGGRVP
jgi:hypothetical protein